MARTKKSGGDTVAWKREGEYMVKVAENVFDDGSPMLSDLLKEVTGNDSPRVMIVADGNVVQRTEGLGKRIGRYVQAHGITLAGAPVVINGGEKVKADNLQSVLKVADAALEAKIGARDAVIALGGGSVLDVAGYAAAQVRGGVNLVRMPTTAASMVDAVFSGYAAVDGANVKDALRVPCQPAAVVVDPSFAKTVLDGVWRGGIGEMVRHAAAVDGTLLKKIARSVEALKSRDAAAMTEFVGECVASRVKKGSTDFALWSAARLEAMSGYKLPHGYAVPIGICIDCAYAVSKGLLKESDQETICGILADCGALEGLAHSRHLLAQADSIVFGLDAWRLSTGSAEITLPCGVGKSKAEPQPDREEFKKVIKEFLEVSTSA